LDAFPKLFPWQVMIELTQKWSASQVPADISSEWNLFARIEATQMSKQKLPGVARSVFGWQIRYEEMLLQFQIQIACSLIRGISTKLAFASCKYLCSSGTMFHHGVRTSQWTDPKVADLRYRAKETLRVGVNPAKARPWQSSAQFPAQARSHKKHPCIGPRITKVFFEGLLHERKHNPWLVLSTRDNIGKAIISI
jgi:hypothetical protein